MYTDPNVSMHNITHITIAKTHMGYKQNSQEHDERDKRQYTVHVHNC